MPRLTSAARATSWFIAGPTASGKSDVALALVELLREQGERPEIVALDSMTLYRGMDIGTAKPIAEERAAVPHHLFDILDVDEVFSVADYVGRADEVCEQILDCGGVPIFVGGTGLYLRSLLRGVFEGPPADAAVRARLEAFCTQHGSNVLHERLAEIDPTAASRIAPGDARRVVRALEVHELTGRPISDWQDEEKPDEVARKVFWLEPERAELHDRINRRTDRMIAAGWLDEAKLLLAGDRPLGQTALQALGYQELFSVARGEAELSDAVERIKARTRQFAKRQHTWFRNLEECQAVAVAPGETADQVATRIFALGSCDE